MVDGVKEVRRLIETEDLPIGCISEHARKDQNIKRGHLHTLHVWWATRPLAACRAVLMATLLPDPADPNCPESFCQAAREVLRPFTGRDLSDPLALRRALLNFIADFAAWENAHKPIFVKTARQLVAAAHPEGPPLAVDPFAGIGSIPFEALRIGAEAFAGDLNSVAVLLNKVALEYLPRYGHRLAEKHRVALRYRGVREPGGGGRVEFEIFEPKSEAEVQPPIVKRFAATCPVCGYTTPYARVREQIRAKRGGTRDARMIAVITLKRDDTRGFRLATEKDWEVAAKAAKELTCREAEHTGPLSLVPDEPLPPEGSLGFRVNLYGMKTWGNLFTPRQALALSTFVRLVREAYAGVQKETGDSEFARAVTTCLAVAVSNSVPMLNADAYYGQDHMRTAFQGSALPMRPDFAEANPLMPKLVGGFAYALEQVAQVLEQECNQGFRPGIVRQSSVTAIPLPDASAPYVITDPPYYDAVPYAALSDFCYVWLRRMLYDPHPDLFRERLTPKSEECIMDPGPPPPGEPEKTKEEKPRRPGGILEIKGQTARLRSVMGRRRYLFGEPQTAATERPSRRRRQGVLFEELEEPQRGGVLTFEPGHTLLDRLHQAMLLFAEGHSEPLRRFLVEEGYGRDPQFWRLADALSRLYPASSREKRLVDGLIVRRKTWAL